MSCYTIENCADPLPHDVPTDTIVVGVPVTTTTVLSAEQQVELIPPLTQMPNQLPHTGQESLPMAGIGLIMVMVGVGLKKRFTNNG